MLKVYQLLNIFGELSHRNKVALYKFLTDRNTYLDKDKIEEFIRLVREMEEDLMYEDDYQDDVELNSVSDDEINRIIDEYNRGIGK